MAAQPAATSNEVKRFEKQHTEAIEALETLANLLASREENRKAGEKLRSELKEADEPAIKKEIEAKIKAVTEKGLQIERQISALTTGVSTDEAAGDKSETFDLRSELESLVQPFIKMMKDATENARQIEKLKRSIVTAQKQQRIAERAIARLTLLSATDVEQSKDAQNTARKHLAGLLEIWRKREQAARDLEETAEQQLNVRQDEQARSSDGLRAYATQFFRSRGLNLLLAITAFGGIFVVMGVIARIAGWVQVRQGIPRSFVTRLVGLLYKVATVIIAFLAMLAVFNIMNDWLLLGIASIFALAMAWFGLKTLPSIAEQINLLLNLGAVQEGERLTFAGVPWLVERLDFYSDLVNPALDGGTFTLPVRELVGLHSRPAADGEAWFPTQRGDWVQLTSGDIGQVVSQTPELVQVEEIGGAILTFETAAFLGEAARNLSTGYRIRSEFGLDYRHQRIATDEIPDKMGAHVTKGLRALLGGDGVTSVDVDLLRADDSAIVFEVEACIPGRHAARYEDVEREVARLLVEACNSHGWVIPFPQMVVHRAGQV